MRHHTRLYSRFITGSLSNVCICPIGDVSNMEFYSFIRSFVMSGHSASLRIPILIFPISNLEHSRAQKKRPFTVVFFLFFFFFLFVCLCWFFETGGGESQRKDGTKELTEPLPARHTYRCFFLIEVYTD